jgi:D-proline reductase (dithiol) PrdB
VPVLARTFEAAGTSTVVVTNMPFWAERIGVPRALAVEFPFGHILGQPHNRKQQLRVLGQALDLLESAPGSGTIVHSEERWPTSDEEAQHLAHPEAPPPIMADMGRYIGQFLRGMRRGNKHASS